ncbi:MAG TPA: HEAT repeat domain-containing protein, partial [Thermodesulfovibrionales bacterium]|nr:HEAT repeat domain-containing protein [Thermodesulfovibrionales bacterium]
SRDENPQVRIAALGGLRRVREERACKRINEALHDEMPEVRKAAITAMSEMECPHGDIKSALEDEDPWVRVYAVKSLSRLLKADAVNSLKPLLNDEEIPVVLSAIDAIAQFGTEDAFGILKPLLEHRDEAVRERVQQLVFGMRWLEDGVETLQ